MPLTRDEALADFRRRYPMYADMPDAELAQNIAQTFPQYRDLLSIESTPPPTAQIKVPPGMARTLIREGVPLLGLLFGGAAGGGLTPLGAAGAGLGYAGGKQLIRAGEALEEVIWPPPAGIRPTYDRPLAGQALRTAEETATGAGLHLFPPVLQRALGWAGRGARSLMGLSSVPSEEAAAAVAQEAAARQGIEMTAAAQSGSPSAAMWETFPTRFPVGRHTAEPTLARVRASAQQAAERTGSMFGPATELETAGQTIQGEVKAIATAQESAPTALVDRFTRALSPTSLWGRGRIPAGKTLQAGMEATETAARSKASAAYDQALAAVPEGTQATLTNVQKVTSEMSALEHRLRGLGKPRVGATAQKLESVSEAKITAEELRALAGDDPAALRELVQRVPALLEMPSKAAVPVRSLPLDFIQEYGLGTASSMPVKDALVLQQRLKSMVRNVSDDYTKRQFRDLLNALTDDIGATGADFRVASAIYKREVAELFAEKGALRKILDAPPGDAARRLLESRHPDELVAIMRGTPSSSRPVIRRLFMDKIKERSLDPRSGEVDPAKLETILREYGEDNLRYVLGGKAYKDLGTLRQTLQTGFGRESRSPVLERLTTARPETIATSLAVGGLKSSAEFDAVWNVLSPEAKRQTRSALYGRLLREEGEGMGGAAIDPGTGMFSMERFVRRLADIPPNIRQRLWDGDAGAAVQDLQTVFRHMNVYSRTAANPSQTSAAWLSAAQGLQAATLLLDVATTLVSGEKLKPRHVTQLGLLFTPTLAGRAIYSGPGQRFLGRTGAGHRGEATMLLGRMLGTQLVPTQEE